MFAQRVRELRRHMTEAERLLWSALRDRRLGGLKFRRQVSVSVYVVDFLCFEARLVVELDGAQHYSVEALAYDARRTRAIEREGFVVVRFPNVQVMRGLASVTEVIGGLASQRIMAAG